MNKHFFFTLFAVNIYKIDTKQTKAIENLTKSNP